MVIDSLKSLRIESPLFSSIANLAWPKPNRKPRITIFIPTYNRLEKLKLAVRSVFQCGELVHLHILDNQSRDGTREWMQRLKGSRNVSIEITLQQSNIGGSNNFLSGFNSVKTEFVVPLADDDELVPGFLSRAIAEADLHSDVIAVIGARAFRDGRSWKPEWDPRRSLGHVTPLQHVKQFFTVGHYTTWSAGLWRSTDSLLSETFRLANDFGLCSDVYFQFKLFSTYNCFLLPFPAAAFHRSTTQQSGTIGLSVLSIIQLEQMIMKIQHDLESLAFEKREFSIHQALSPLKSRYLDFIKENQRVYLAANSPNEELIASINETKRLEINWCFDSIRH